MLSFCLLRLCSWFTISRTFIFSLILTVIHLHWTMMPHFFNSKVPILPCTNISLKWVISPLILHVNIVPYFTVLFAYCWTLKLLLCFFISFLLHELSHTVYWIVRKCSVLFLTIRNKAAMVQYSGGLKNRGSRITLPGFGLGCSTCWLSNLGSNLAQVFLFVRLGLWHHLFHMV